MGRTKLWCALVIAVLLRGRAAADPSPKVVFAHSELAEALTLRGIDANEVVVVVDDAGRIEIRIRGKRRVIDLEGRQGMAAARLVALAAGDLSREGSMPEMTQVERTAVEPVVAVHRSPGIGLGFSAMPTLTMLLENHRPLFGAQAGASVSLGGPWRITVDAGYASGRVEDTAVGATLTAIPFRAALGWRRGAFQLRAGATAVPYSVATTPGDSGTLVGATAVASVHGHIGRGFRFIIELGADAYANRVVYMAGNDRVFGLARVAPWLGAGLGWEQP